MARFAVTVRFHLVIGGARTKRNADPFCHLAVIRRQLLPEPEAEHNERLLQPAEAAGELSGVRGRLTWSSCGDSLLQLFVMKKVVLFRVLP